MQTYTGGCHCGKVRFEVKMKLEGAIECNCSHCAMQGALLAFVPTKDFSLIKGEESLKEYRFNKKVIAHLFCEDCGIEPMGRGKGRDGSDMVAVNVRCIDGIDLTAVNRMPFDGKSL